MAKKAAIKNDYMDCLVGVYVKSAKGFYRSIGLPLRDVLTRKSWNNAVELYRASKSKQLPKGDSALKRNIKAYQPSGDYGKGVARSTKNDLATATRLVQLDFDQKVPIKRIKELFNKYKWIAVAAQSCGGEGFYLLVHCETSEHYEEYFTALCKYFRNNEKLEVDQAVGSINEIRFVSLTSEVIFREDADVWKQKEKVVKSTMDKVMVPMDGKLIALPEILADESGAHYYDIVSWAGKQNSNGVPLDKAIDAFPVERISKKSSFYNRPDKVKVVVASVYDRYSEQHGVAMVTDVMLAGENLDLPQITFDPKDTQERHSQQIVDTVCTKYLFKTNASSGEIYRFIGTHWVKVEEYEIKNFLTAAALQCRYDQSRARLPRFKATMLEDLVDRTNTNFDIPLTAFNLKNGILQFIEGDVLFREHSDEYNFTYVLDYEYNPDKTDAPIFTRFIERIIPNEFSRKMLFQYFGAGFLDNAQIKFEKTLILLGSGSNGKSTLMDLLASLFGAAVGRFNLERLTDQKDSSLEARNIYNKVFGVCAEAKVIKDFNIWKGIVSKETIDIKYLYKDAFQSNNYGRLITCMNEAPNVDAVYGAMRRALFIGMGAVIGEAEQDLQLLSKLTAERTQILNRIIEGYKEIYASKGIIQISAESKELTTDVIDSQDQVLEYIRGKGYFPVGIETKHLRKPLEERYKIRMANLKLPGEVIFLTRSELYSDYREWCKDEKMDYPLQKKKFMTRFMAVTAERLKFGVDKFESIEVVGYEKVVIGTGMNLEIIKQHNKKNQPFDDEPEFIKGDK